ncbi:MAG: monovalent cation:proton antiporter-2 (CPA2) family protein [Rhodospirillales bacterium]
MESLHSATIILAAAVITVPVARRLGLGALLGFLVAGAAIGPEALGLVTDVDAILHFAELGVVLLLFVIGLELQPSRLWTLRKPIAAFGFMQMFITGGVLALIGRLMGLDPAPAAVVGLTLSLSSTAFALQTLAERGELTTRHGRSAFAILLFQDIAAIPVLAAVPYLAGPGSGMFDIAGLVAAAETIGILVAVAVAGRYLLRYALRVVAATRVREVFTAAALLTVVGTAGLMTQLGLSAALGTFIAGVLLADSEFRHELEADLEPFKGLLLGLFFMAVGMSLDLGLLLSEPVRLFALVAGLLLAKGLVLYGLGRANGLDRRSARSLAVALGEGGEFAFVIFGAAATYGLLGHGFSDRMVAVVTLSMAITPLLFALNARLTDAKWVGGEKTAAYETLPGDESQVIIAGFGRFGQIIGRMLSALRIRFTALEKSPEQVDFVRQYGSKVYYGDASRLDLLQAARADKAEIFVLAIDDVEDSLRAAETVLKHFPQLKVFARARNRAHAYRLMELGIAVVWRETFLSSLDMAKHVLEGLGLPDYEAERVAEKFRAYDEQRLYGHFGQHQDEKRMQVLAKKAAEELRDLFAQDAEQREEEPRPKRSGPR